MIITKCSIAGVDDEVDIAKLKDLTKEFPFVEWSVLIGGDDRFGTLRYPSIDWITKFSRAWLPSSLHYCGQALKNYLGDNEPHEVDKGNATMGHNFNRIQLNLSVEMVNKCRLQIIRSIYSEKREVILPIREATKDLWKLAIGRPYVSCLFDASGGRGVIPTEWPAPITSIRCGYAGGINPDNVAEIMVHINREVSKGFIWLDLESGVRTDNKFDLNKVRSILKYVDDFKKLTE